jgi:hypothetical protein
MEENELPAQQDEDIEANELPALSTKESNSVIASRTTSSRPNLAAARTTTHGSSRSRFHGGQDGYCVFSEDEGEEGPALDDEKAISRAMTEQGALEVKWDGDADPRNPRTFAKARKWLIVIVVSASSLCV